jgi:hypothetical protein
MTAKGFNTMGLEKNDISAGEDEKVLMAFGCPGKRKKEQSHDREYGMTGVFSPIMPSQVNAT